MCHMTVRLQVMTSSFLLPDWSSAVSSCAVIGQVLAELQFSVHQLSEEDTSVKFDLQIVRYSLHTHVYIHRVCHHT